MQRKRCVSDVRWFGGVWAVRTVEGRNRRLDCPETLSLGDDISNKVPKQCKWERKDWEPPMQPHSTTAVRTSNLTYLPKWWQWATESSYHMRGSP
jgi:hypothetical protein